MTPLKNRSTARPAVAFAALFGVLTLAGCGASAPTSTADSDTTTQTDAPAAPVETTAPAGDGGDGSATGECDLWTLDEVSGATGVEITETSGTDQQGQFSCIYSDLDATGAATYVVMTSEAGIAPSAGYDAVSEGTEPVSGIGDQAKWHEAGTLYVMSGGNLYIVTLLGSELDDQQKQDASIDLARIAIDRFR